MTYYRIRGYGGKRLSIDEVLDDGCYLCQVAFWFRTKAEARVRLAEIIREDAERGRQSAEWVRAASQVE
jgi:hypothetical protein